MTSTSFRFQFWFNDGSLDVGVTLCVVDVIGTSREHEGAAHVPLRGIALSVSVAWMPSGMRKAQNRNVSASRKCRVNRNVSWRSLLGEANVTPPATLSKSRYCNGSSDECA
jgi:hypothetical protein